MEFGRVEPVEARPGEKAGFAEPCFSADPVEINAEVVAVASDGFGGREHRGERHRRRLKRDRILAIAPGNIEQGGHDPEIVPARAKIAGDDEPHASAIDRSLGPDAGKARRVDKL